jgi:phage shock protein E
MVFAVASLLKPAFVLFAMSMPDFNTRAQMFGIASDAEVCALADKPSAILLDVRSDAELETGKLEPSKLQWAHSIVTPDAAPELEESPENVVGSDKATPIIVYCGSGKRALKAKQVLESKGYTNVINAGGLVDVDYLKKY